MRNVMLVLGLIVAMPCLGQNSDTRYSETEIAQFEGCVRVYRKAEERNECFNRNSLLKGKSPEELMADLAYLATTTPDERRRIKAEQDRQVCLKGLSSEDAALVSANRIGLGMSEPALLCSWGNPNSINRSVGAWGVHKQYVYQNANVYVENGQVTSWQD
jgi:hypothetical protein